MKSLELLACQVTPHPHEDALHNEFLTSVAEYLKFHKGAILNLGLTIIFGRSCARGSPKRQILYQRVGHFQVFVSTVILLHIPGQTHDLLRGVVTQKMEFRKCQKIHFQFFVGLYCIYNEVMLDFKVHLKLQNYICTLFLKKSFKIAFKITL